MNDRVKSALVTGGAKGIGWATCRELVAHGWRVAVADLDVKAASERAAGDPQALVALELDVRLQESVEAAVQQAVCRLGGLDLLVNNAGIQRHGALDELPWSTWEAVLDVNLNGTMRCLQAAGRHMLEHGGGSIVNVISIAAERGQPRRAPYAVSKAGVAALTRTAAVEWAQRGIRVNAVGPGYVDTDLIKEFVSAGALNLAPVLARTPMRRLAAPEEIARVIRFLASDDASFITGQLVYADGGFLADYGVRSEADEH